MTQQHSLHKITFMKRIILASSSPRRKELLSKITENFITEPADIDERLGNRPLTEEIRALSLRKAMHVLEKHPDAIVIGADTIVAIGETILGKPADREEAFHMLRALSGNTHQVITGLAVLSSERQFNDVSVSNVTFAPLSDEEISAYLDTNEYADKAGSYAIQGFAGKFITGISGDYYSIMGLPLNMLYEESKNFILY